AFGGVGVLAAGKAVRKQRVGARLVRGAVEQRGKILSAGVGKLEALSRHALLRSTAGARRPPMTTDLPRSGPPPGRAGSVLAAAGRTRFEPIAAVLRLTGWRIKDHCVQCRFRPGYRGRRPARNRKGIPCLFREFAPGPRAYWGWRRSPPSPRRARSSRPKPGRATTGSGAS